MNSRQSFLFTVIIIISATFAVRASNNMFMTTLPLLARYSFHFSEVYVGLISTAGASGTFIMSAMINARLTSARRRSVFIISSFAYMAVFPLFYISSALVIWPLVIIAGFVLGAIMPNIITSASLFSDRKVRERILSLYTLTLSVSLVAGPAIESEILRFFSLEQSFLFFSILPAIVFVSAFGIKFPDEGGKRITGGAEVMSSHGFRAAIFNIMTYNIPFALILTFGGIFAREYLGASYSLITLLFSLFFLTSFASRLALTLKPPDNLPMLMTMSVIITGVGLVVLSISRDLLVFSISFLILGFPHGFTYPLSIISISRSISPEKRNIANSYFFSIMMLVGAVMPFASGILVDTLGLRYAFMSIIPVVAVLYALLRMELGRDKAINRRPGERNTGRTA
ncbi:MAG: MFS transporter [Thermoplasmataceae archaeon]